jgi:hypothetical protein
MSGVITPEVLLAITTSLESYLFRKQKIESPGASD